MFGFSLTKLLFTVLVIAVIWWGFKAVAARGRISKPDASPKKRMRKKKGTPFFKHSEADGGTEELVECPKCGVYALPEKKCEKDRCPM